MIQDLATKVIIIGSGGHAQVLVDTLMTLGQKPFGYFDRDASKTGTQVLGISILGTDDQLQGDQFRGFELVLGVGSINRLSRRDLLFDQFKRWGYVFRSVVHPTATLSRFATLGEGAQVLAGAIIQTGVRLAENVIVNTGAIVDHDCIIGAHTHIATGAVLSGGVTVGKNVLIGTGAIVKQGITIGDHVLVAAGAVVVHDVPAGVAVMGVPARQVECQK